VMMVMVMMMMMMMMVMMMVMSIRPFGPEYNHTRPSLRLSGNPLRLGQVVHVDQFL
jgi:hypothetical protein